MLWRLLLVMAAAGLGDLLLLVRLARIWGVWTTIAVLIFSGAMGMAMARAQGLRVLRAIREKTERGQLPADDMADGLMLLAAAALLMIPGVATDVAAFVLLIPPVRRLAWRVFRRWLIWRMGGRRAFMYPNPGFHPISEEPPPGAPPLEDLDDR